MARQPKEQQTPPTSGKVPMQKTDMSEPEPPVPPVLKRPPGYRDPNAPPPQVGPTKLPNRKPVLPSTMYDADKKHRRSRRGASCCCSCHACCCCICLFLFLLILIIVAASAIFYLWFEPKLPVFHLQSFRVTNLTVTASPDSGSRLKARIASVVEFQNPNSKLAVYYGHFDVEMAVAAGNRNDDEEIDFGKKRLEGFRQGSKNVRRLKVENELKNTEVDSAFGSKLRKKEAVVRVVVKTSVGVEFWGLKVGKIGVDVKCGGVKLKDVESGGVMPKCVINTMKWINIH